MGRCAAAVPHSPIECDLKRDAEVIGRLWRGQKTRHAGATHGSHGSFLDFFELSIAGHSCERGDRSQPDVISKTALKVPSNPCAPSKPMLRMDFLRTPPRAHPELTVLPAPAAKKFHLVASLCRILTACLLKRSESVLTTPG